MHVHYCLPIIKSFKKEVLELMKMHEDKYSFFEVWVDYIEDFDEQFVLDLVKKFEKKLVIVTRRKNLEDMHMDLQIRKKIVTEISGTNVLVDFDIQQQKEELEFVKTNNLQLNTIISYHNYEMTPDEKSLEDIIQEMLKFEPEIVKIATMCQSEKDALRLLQLQQLLKEKNIKHIVLGMGEPGIITRIFGTLWGNEMIFAPVDAKDSSAPGQMSREQLVKVFNLI